MIVMWKGKGRWRGGEGRRGGKDGGGEGLGEKKGGKEVSKRKTKTGEREKNIRIALHVQRGDQVVEPGLLEHEVQMRRPPAVAVQHLEQFPHRPVVRDGIAHRHDALEPEFAVRVAREHGAAVGIRAGLALHVVVARAVGFPHVDLAPLDGLAAGVL